MKKNTLVRFATTALLLAFTGGVTSALAAEDGKPWKNSAQITYLSANGNTKSSTLGAEEAFRYDWTKVALDLTGAAMGANSEGVTTAEQYNAAEKVSWKFSGKNYLFEKIAWDKNRFAAIRNRYDFTAGLGRELISRPKDTLVAELGGGYTKEERIAAKDEDFASGRAFSKYTHSFSETASFFQDAEYLHNFEDPDGYRANTNTGVVMSLTTHVSLKASYVWKYVNEPAPGIGKSDTLTAISLIFNY